ncbi:MAG TPA: IS110 family transposase [Mycobacterium sp.]|jgi:transposase|nr:IS110 family transposase [Mycobacterium sp.]
MALVDLVDHVIGVDPDRDHITAAVVCSRTQGELASRVFATTARGYGQAIRWAKEHTAEGRRAWSVESTGSYGAGLAAALATKGEFVIEFDHPSTRPSKDGAKSDSLDAVRAAREILGRKTWATPRSRGTREGLRTLITARDSAKVARVAAINVLKALVVTAPADLREELRGRSLMELVARCQRLRPDTATDPEHAATKLSLRSTASRVRQLTDECRELEAAMIPLVRSMAPALLEEPGIGVLMAAQILVSWSHPGRCRDEAAFARLGGVAPLEATSGQTQTRHRLSRGGDRQLNRALHTVILARVKHHQATKDYVVRRVSEGKTKREAMRCLKRYYARHLFRLLEAAPMTS